jgi:hypothetical protein
LAATAGCGQLGTDLNQVVALEVFFPDSGLLEIGDTLHPSARALNGHGDSVAAQIFWTSLDTGIVSVVDSGTGKTFAKAVGTGRLQARFGALRSNPENVFVFVRLDSASAPGVTRDTVVVTSADSLSDSLIVKAWADTAGAPGRPVVYTFDTYPPSDTTVTLVPKGTVVTNASGIAVVQVRLRKATVPDSVVVSAAVLRPNGTAIPGSPVRFVVEFRP